MYLCLIFLESNLAKPEFAFYSSSFHTQDVYLYIKVYFRHTYCLTNLMLRIFFSHLYYNILLIVFKIQVSPDK